jgi:hypothetical protein
MKMTSIEAVKYVKSHTDKLVGLYTPTKDIYDELMKEFDKNNIGWCNDKATKVNFYNKYEKLCIYYNYSFCSLEYSSFDLCKDNGYTTITITLNNRLESVLNDVGIKRDVPFYIDEEDADKVGYYVYNPYVFDGKSVIDTHKDNINPYILISVIAGETKVSVKEKFPKIGCTYYSVMCDGQIAENRWDNGYLDYSLLDFNNVFKTKKEAIEHIEDIRNKYNALKKINNL